MIALSLIPLIGVVVAAVACWFVQHGSQGRLDDSQKETNDAVQDKLRRSKALDAKFTQDLMDGTEIDDVVDSFTKERAAIHALSTDMPWMWEADDLKKWAAAEIRDLAAAIFSRARLINFFICMAIFVVVLAVEGILYNQMSATQPVLAPQMPLKKTPVVPPSQTNP